jgi:hypothetical protein
LNEAANSADAALAASILAGVRALNSAALAGSAEARAVAPAITLADYVTRIKGLTLDAWQADLCARLEKAFWLARADRFAFIEVNLGAGPAYKVAPSGFTINLDEFNAQKGKGAHTAIAARHNSVSRSSFHRRTQLGF